MHRALALAVSAALAAQDERPAAANTPLLLVVAPAPLLPALQPLVAHKQATGLAVELVPLATALRDDGADDPERLKRHLFARRRAAPELRYVLLVGDADTMPVRFMVLDRATQPAFDYAFYPSDLYYADLCKRDGSFEDWNATTVGYHRRYYGEVRGERHKHDPINFDDIDYLPELAVGRWPVATTEQVERLVRKTIAFETSVSAGKARTLVCLGVPGWIESRPLLQQIAVGMPAGWQVHRHWWQEGEADPAIRKPDADSVLQTLAATGPAFLLHAGHGDEQGFDGSLACRHLALLPPSAPPGIVFSIGCSTARLCTLPPYEAYVDADGGQHQGTNGGEVFTAPPPPPAVYQSGPHNQPSFGERLLADIDGGAVAYIGCDTGGQPCAATLMAAFGEGLAGGRHPRLGELWQFAVGEYWRRERLAELQPTDSWYPPSIFFQAMKYLLLGDPSLRLPE